MQQQAKDQLNLRYRTDAELDATIRRFHAKWQHKVYKLSKL